eukprot:TRINITY_DN8538_c0_g1_i1.p1 TRINITY_DN8538_c0_g1~~TRINITY_DN8538_c0_g1_i1.p1  ORF type:complete len:195 (-),score=60.01 TRINITY_DN8538_c0_g1_i1:59-643(-)
MGNAQARKRMKAQEFHFIAKNSAFLNREVVSDQYNELIAKYPLGKMDADDFKKVFRLAFPERPEEKLTALTEKLRNVEKTDGTIPMHSIAMLLYLFSDAPIDENLGQIFNLFDMDGNGNISINELLDMMAFFIEIGMDTGAVDMAKTMAEVFQRGDTNKDEKLSKTEFILGMKGHPVTAKILQVKTIDALLLTF